jgi:hypothetical protein
MTIISSGSRQPLFNYTRDNLRHAVETRYPGDDATKRHAQTAMRWATRIRDECRNLLGIKSHRE